MPCRINLDPQVLTIRIVGWYVSVSFTDLYKICIRNPCGGYQNKTHTVLANNIKIITTVRNIPVTDDPQTNTH